MFEKDDKKSDAIATLTPLLLGAICCISPNQKD
jgi:hypothetical protein